MKVLKRLFRAVKHWFWWKFIATDLEKTTWQAVVYGTGIMNKGKFLDVKDFYKMN